jgi:hydroxypyruvate isomerase
LERFEAAAAAGFKAVEFTFPYAHAAGDVAAMCARHGLTVALFNAPPGHYEAGERGLAAVPGREADARNDIETALRYADIIDARSIHVLAGVQSESCSRDAMLDTFVSNLRFASDGAGSRRQITIEPLNPRDMPGYVLNNTRVAQEVLQRVGRSNVRLQFDFYHCQINEGDLTRRLEALINVIGHVQIAGVPRRNEPDRGELNIHYLLAQLDALGYGGYVGAEYRPDGDTVSGLSWAREYLGQYLDDPRSNARQC